MMPLLCDANTGWKRHEALMVVNGVKDYSSNIYIEQPCLSYEECLAVRKHSPLPMVLDECIDDVGNISTTSDNSILTHINILLLGILSRALSDHAVDLINLKISKVGGLTKARLVRDFAVANNVPMNIEDTWSVALPSSLLLSLVTIFTA